MISWFTKIEWKLVKESNESERKGREREWFGIWMLLSFLLDFGESKSDGKMERLGS